MRKAIFSAVLAAALAAGGGASAVEILKAEPGKGALSKGAAVYVDNGKCPKGQVMMVFAEGGGKRGRSCVARPN